MAAFLQSNAPGFCQAAAVELREPAHQSACGGEHGRTVSLNAAVRGFLVEHALRGHVIDD